MTKAEQKLEAEANKLRDKIADAEATLGSLRSKLARIEAQISGGPTPENGLDLLWKAALPTARTRSSKHQCRTEFHRIPKHERPTVQVMLDALRIWNRSEEWRKDGNAFVPGLHRWIKNRQWENLPEVSRPDPGARYRVSTPKPAPTDDAVVDPAEIARLLSLKPTDVP